MAYAFAPSDANVAKGVRRIAREELASCLAMLDAPGPGDGGAEAAGSAAAEGTAAEGTATDADAPADSAERRVHGLRKNVKKLRALFRLIRPHFEGYALENAVLRDAARGISGLRDAEVMLVTLGRLAVRAGPRDRLALDRLRDHLERCLQAARTGEGPRQLAEFRAAIIAVEDRSTGWRITGKGFAVLRPGLARTWRQAQKLGAEARGDPRPEAVHEWRKVVKDHWYQARLLAPVWPEMMAPHVTAADSLGEDLGDHHDLAVFLAALPDMPLSAAEAEAIARLARKRLKTIEGRAFTLADKLFAGSDEALAERWGAWWEAWRAAEG